MQPEICEGFKIFPPSTFYPIHYSNWRQYFDTNNLNQTMEIISKARAIHVWNKLSKSESVTIGSQVPYALIAKNYCPRVYSHCGVYF